VRIVEQQNIHEVLEKNLSLLFSHVVAICFFVFNIKKLLEKHFILINALAVEGSEAEIDEVKELVGDIEPNSFIGG
jgi:hypothetical protein